MSAFGARADIAIDGWTDCLALRNQQIRQKFFNELILRRRLLNTVIGRLKFVFANRAVPNMDSLLSAYGF